LTEIFDENRCNGQVGNCNVSVGRYKKCEIKQDILKTSELVHWQYGGELINHFGENKWKGQLLIITFFCTSCAKGKMSLGAFSHSTVDFCSILRKSIYRRGDYRLHADIVINVKKLSNKAVLSQETAQCSSCSLRFKVRRNSIQV